MTVNNGFQAMITQHSWMFLSSFEKLREEDDDDGNRQHGAIWAQELLRKLAARWCRPPPLCAVQTMVNGYKGTYCRLIEPTSQQGKEDMFLAGENRYTANQDDLGRFRGHQLFIGVVRRF